jgi:hypothetical protein
LLGGSSTNEADDVDVLVNVNAAAHEVIASSAVVRSGVAHGPTAVRGSVRGANCATRSEDAVVEVIEIARAVELIKTFPFR